MKAFYNFFRGLHRWLLVNLAVLALFFALRGRRDVMTALSERFSMPLERALGALWSRVPFSVAELCYAAAILGLPAFLIASAFAIRRAEYKRDVFYARLLGLANVVLSLYAAFCLLWGVNFYADDFCDKSGLAPEPVAYEDLVAVTKYFALQTIAHADLVQRGGDGAYAVPREDSLNFAPSLYEPVYEEFPFLALDGDPVPKKVFFSRVMSAMNVTGLYFPFTGESNLNMDFPAATFPFTVAHELAHRRGVASEQQCNFLAVVVSTRSDDAAYQYSGWFTGYIHLSNALYAADPDAWREIRLALPATVEADLQAASAYWARYEGVASRVSGRAYDAMLRGYGHKLGMRSYGAVVDLLVAYYKQ